ncbi:DUF934 domain-containing protein [Bosea sp. CS1GBMeth4]|uniref:DUF934 domain-containing protein n=1 Tax=Bosea sp. CS1GBMeth4 TaxID=1892849 RepID=UPI001646A3EC|nr:DUF934 domain-containing protein [Bosea sp. CS1GBMeth4]
MPLLDRHGAKADLWTRSEGAAIGNLSHALVAWAALPEALAQRSRDQRIGAVLPNTVRMSELKLVMRQLSLIAIGFPSFADGRGFSLARLIRNHGFAGSLRASGPLIPDQFAYALACGFDEVELPQESAARQPVEQWLTALGRISHGYQRGYGDSGNILDRRRAARLKHAAAC